MTRKLIMKLALRFRSEGKPSPTQKRVGSWILRNVPGMLTCEQMEAFVHDYQEGTLPEKQRRQFDFHLALCPMCAVFFETYPRSIELGQRVFETDGLPTQMPEELVGAILLAAVETS